MAQFFQMIVVIFSIRLVEDTYSQLVLILVIGIHISDILFALSFLYKFKYSDDDSLHSKDGSMDSDLPMSQLAELFNVNHFIVSQTNPHAALLSSLSLSALNSVWSAPILALAAGAVAFLKDQIRAWLNNCLTLITTTSMIPRSAITRGFTQVLLQEYEGRYNCDVTIFPWRDHSSVLRAFRIFIENPSRDDVLAMISASERNTWSYIPQIKGHCAIEVCLEHCVQHLRASVAKLHESGIYSRWGAQQRHHRDIRANHVMQKRPPSSSSLHGDAQVCDKHSAGSLFSNTAARSIYSASSALLHRQYYDHEREMTKREHSRAGRVPSFFTSPSQTDLEVSVESSVSDLDKGSSTANIKIERTFDSDISDKFRESTGACHMDDDSWRTNEVYAKSLDNRIPLQTCTYSYIFQACNPLPVLANSF